MIDRRRLLQLAAASAAWGARSARAQPMDVEKLGTQYVTGPAQKSIDKGLGYLASRQKEDGSFGDAGYSRNTAVAALAGMAFMASGSTPGRGPHGANVDRCVDFILAHTEESGFINVEGATTHGPMYGHGFATLFLSEAYGMTLRPDIREKLSKAVQLIVQTQNREGGWRYQPVRHDADISVTICQVMALRAARNAGLFIPAATIERCIAYVKKSQNPDGGFMYMLPEGESQFPRSAAGVVALYSAGIYEGAEITRGLSYLMQFLPQGEAFTRETHYFYGHYYAVQAMWHAGDEHWRRWFPAIRDELVARQQPDGSWMDSICLEYGTAMACIIMQIPNNFLPIFQR